MSEDSSSSQSNTNKTSEPSWLERLLQCFSSSEPRSREELIQVIRDAALNKVVGQEAVEIFEGALSVANLKVREIMVPRSQMVVIKADEHPREFLPKVIESGHSSFPVMVESIDEIKGVLLAKDLRPLILEGESNFTLEEILRAANIIPESKRLNVLLK